MFPSIQIKKKTGNEPFLNTDMADIRLVDFWAWGFSDLLGNTERGKLAEFIVAIALGISDDTITGNWHKYDLQTKDGIRIEVKASAYIQTWEQQKESKIMFSIRPTYGWDSATNEYGKEPKRHSDVYVFCVLKHKEQSTVNPLDLNQWEFYVLSTVVLNKVLPKQKSVTLNKLIKCGAAVCDFKNLKDTIYEQNTLYTEALK